MLAAGELAADDGRYRLAGHLLERQARQEASRRPHVVPAWDGTWRTAVVVADRRPPAERAALRTAMTRHRFGELREGVWLRPANVRGPGPDVDGVTWLSSRPDDPGGIVARLWDVPGWAARAGRLRAAMAGVVDDLERGDEDALAPAFEISAAVLRHLQADPLLPDDLLPRRWPGAALRSEYDRYDVAFKTVWRSWFRRYRHT
jgi:phenylacetic acid degradation operon negative regulatory protein